MTLRCETCNRPIGKIGGSNDCPISIPSHLDVTEVFVIELIGCASHSSATGAENVLDIEWIKEEFFQWISTKIQSPSIYACEQKWKELVIISTTNDRNKILDERRLLRGSKVRNEP